MRATALLPFFISAIMAHSADKLYITANGETRTATLETNASVEQLKKLLPLTISMSDYGGWEKVGDLPNSITRNDRQTTARPGDIMLYQGQSVVIFYGDNSWAYTPLGKMDNASASDVKEFLKGNTVSVTFSLSPSAGIECVGEDEGPEPDIYDLNGRKVSLGGKNLSDLPKGFYIVNGEKTLLK